MNRLYSLLENCHWRGNIALLLHISSSVCLYLAGSLFVRVQEVLGLSGSCWDSVQGQELDMMVLVGCCDFMILLLEGSESVFPLYPSAEMPHGAMLPQAQTVAMIMMRLLSSPASSSWFFPFLPVHFSSLCPAYPGASRLPPAPPLLPGW